MKKVIIIGAGLGGLSAACRLARSGFDATVLEKNDSAGGKVGLVESAGYRFDTGASLLTMRQVFDELFEFCGRRIEEYAELVRIDPICRYFWADGTRLDASEQIEKTEAEIEKIEPADVASFRRYLADSKEKYEIAERTFLAKSFNQLPSLLNLKNLPGLLKISPLKTLDKHNRKYFKSAKLRQLFNRFATYNGSSPFRTRATFALIPFVEFGLGAWYVKGGIYRLPAALEKLARELSVEFRYGREVSGIKIEHGRASGVKLTNGESLESDIVIANSDAIETYRNLIGAEHREIYTDRKLRNIEPSCSGFVLLLGTNRKFDLLAHHNIFFSDDPKAEFGAIFDSKRPAKDPTVYVCASSVSDETQAPKNCENLFVLVNAPYASSKTDWRKEAAPYRDLIVDRLERSGLTGLENSIEFEQMITPEDFETRYRANRGSIYGISSNGILSAFMRVPNKAQDIESLYFVGGTTHPGGGMPLVLLSGKMAADLILKERTGI